MARAWAAGACAPRAARAGGGASARPPVRPPARARRRADGRPHAAASATSCEVEVSARDERHMRAALELACAAGAAGEVPVGAVVVAADGETVLAGAANAVEATGDPTAHAEVLALRAAAAACAREREANEGRADDGVKAEARARPHAGTWRLSDATLYVTLEPCSMCVGACLCARVGRVVWGAPNPTAGAGGGWVDLLGAARGDPAAGLSASPRAHGLHPGVASAGGVLGAECAALLRAFFRARRRQARGARAPPPPPPRAPRARRTRPARRPRQPQRPRQRSRRRAPPGRARGRAPGRAPGARRCATPRHN
eukprot:PRCOL_00006665-RA